MGEVESRAVRSYRAVRVLVKLKNMCVELRRATGLLHMPGSMSFVLHC